MEPTVQLLREPHRPPHYPALDGLRGAAILLVLLHHLTIVTGGGRLGAALRGPANFGWVGVDLFFVLSGFLITGILSDAKGAAHYFRNFYLRRSVRIFPLYYAFLAGFMVLLPRVAPGYMLAAYGSPPHHPVWFWLYASNISMVTVDPAFPHMAPPLTVTWSLAIEEQFYLVWPAVVALCPRRMMWWVCVGVAAAALAWRVAAVAAGHRWLFVQWLTPGRMDGLAIGGFCALTLRTATGFTHRAWRWAPVTAAVVLLAVLAYQRTFHWDGGPCQMFGYTAVAVLFAAAVVAAATAGPASPFVRFFSAEPLRFFGRYSYAVYLFHLPVALALLHLATAHGHPCRTLLDQFGFYVATLGLTVVAALISWNVYENRFLRLKRYFPADG